MVYFAILTARRARPLLAALVFALVTPAADAQLYDLATDPGETKNLVLEKPDLAAELKALLESSKQSGRSRP